MNRLTVVYVFAWVVAVVACVSGAMRLMEAHAAAGDAASNLDRLDLLKTAIMSLRSMEDRAQLQEKSKVDSNKAILNIARNSAIKETQIIEIERLPLQKLGESGYQRDDVSIRIKDVTAVALMSFLVSCSTPKSGYSPVSVLLRAQPTSDRSSQDVWVADLILTRVLFAAKNPSSDQ